MKKISFSALLIAVLGVVTISCSDNIAAEAKPRKFIRKIEADTLLVKKDGPSIGIIETETYVLKLHRAFAYQPEESDILVGFKPKDGYKFVYLDVSLKNKSAAKLDGGALFIALKVTSTKGVEYKKPSTALAAYATEHPEDNNEIEYNALWESFEPNEFHREIVYAVEVPKNVNKFILHMPTDNKRKEWKELEFSL